MGTVAALAIAVPLICASALVIAGTWLPRLAADWFALTVSVAVTAMCAVLVVHVSRNDELVYWFGGWRPGGGVALGIDLAVDPMGAGLATLSATLVTTAFVYSFHYFDDVGPMFHVLLLVFLAATVGFVLSGDIFNMFVLFELMSVGAYALTGYRVERAGPLQGAVNFAITNSVGGIFILVGIALIYGRTGALNLAQIGHSLSAGPVDGLVIVAFGFLATGFLVKAAIVPFHFWLPDAYTVAPIPVVILFAGVMGELGLYGVARVYWSSFQPAFSPDAGGIRAVLIGLGILTALLGAVMCFQQRHIKRMLAFITLGHAGLFLIGIGLLESSALGGTAMYIVTDGLTKSALFLCAGVVIHRCQSADVETLYGAGKDLRAVGGAFLVGGFALAGVPPLGSFYGKALMEEAASKLGYGWVEAVFVAVAAVTAGAVIRSWAWIFRGAGRTIDPQAAAEEESSEEEEEEEQFENEAGHDRTPAQMGIPLFVVLVAGCFVGGLPGLAEKAASAARAFTDPSGYASMVLHGRPSPPVAVSSEPPTLTSYLLAATSGLAGIALATASLFRNEIPGTLRQGLERATHTPLALLRRAHSGHPGDYVVWLMIGTVILGAAFAGVIG